MKYIEIPAEGKKIYVAKSEIKSLVMEKKDEVYQVNIQIGNSVLTKVFPTYEEAEKFAGKILEEVEK